MWPIPFGTSRRAALTPFPAPTAAVAVGRTSISLVASCRKRAARPPNSVSEAAMAPRLDLVAVGNAVVDHTHRVSVLPRRDEGVFILDRRSGPGGVEANVITAAARLGLRTGIIARIGSDADGMMILEDLKQRDVDVSRIQIGCADDTAYTFVFVDGRGDRIMMTGGRGVRDLTLNEADDDLVRAS